MILYTLNLPVEDLFRFWGLKVKGQGPILDFKLYNISHNNSILNFNDDSSYMCCLWPQEDPNWFWGWKVKVKTKLWKL